MKKLTNESKKIYTYYCDKCKKEISYKDKTLNKIYVEREYNKKEKVCDLCNDCYKECLEKRRIGGTEVEIY